MNGTTTQRALVLIADDDRADVRLLKRLLEYEGYAVSTAATGNETLKLYEQSRPDLILLDIVLPDLDGFEVCEKLQTLPGGSTTPILILTSIGDEQASVDRAFAAGAADYINKPVVRHWAVLSQRIRRLIRSKQAEEALERERNLLRTLIDSIPDYIFAKDSAGRYLVSNLAHALAVNVLRPEDLIGKTAFEAFPPHLAAQFDADDRAIMESGEALINVDRRTIDARGQERMVFTTKVPLKDPQGRVIGLVGVSRDVTERKQLEETLAQKALLHTLIDSLPSFIYFKDREGRIVLSNTAHAQQTGRTPDEMAGKTDFDLFPPELAARYQADEQSIIQDGQPLLNLEEPSLDSNKQPIWVLTHKVPVRNSQGEIIGIIGITQDITERKQAEQQRLELAIVKERTDLLQALVTNLSHDLKTPLSVINSSIYLLERVLEPDKQKQQLSILKSQTMYLAELIEDILALAQLDSVSQLTFAPLDVNRLVRDIAEWFRSLLEKKHLTTTLGLDPALPLVSVNEGELHRMLINLVENALHYTPSGGAITLRTRVQADSVVIELSDTGIGITQADLPHIFERFYRADKARITDTAGTGLGLAIVKKIVDLHHGRISVESTIGVGSTFQVFLPLNRH